MEQRGASSRRPDRPPRAIEQAVVPTLSTGSASPSTWGAPLYEGVTDADPGTPGIQFVDLDAVNVGSLPYYRITADNGCQEEAVGPRCDAIDRREHP